MTITRRRRSRGVSRPPPLAVDAVVFDMDGLLLDTELLAREALQYCGKEIGLDCPDRISHLMIGLPADACRMLLVDHFGEDVPVDALFEACAERLNTQIATGSLRVKRGALELLRYLSAAEVPSAVATSSSRQKATHRLKAGGIAEHFRAIVTRDEVARGKPHPDLYLRAAQILGIAPDRCLALEDSHNGVRAAYAAGMPVIMVPDLLLPTDEMRQKCRAIVKDLGAIVPLLATQGQSQ